MKVLRFQQDGVTCHTDNEATNLLKETFDERDISRHGTVVWPSKSCDLTPLDYILWGYVKSLVYAAKHEAIAALKENILHVITDIRSLILQKEFENWVSWLEFIRASRGGHLPEITFLIIMANLYLYIKATLLTIILNYMLFYSS